VFFVLALYELRREVCCVCCVCVCVCVCVCFVSVCGDGEVELEACRNGRDTICGPVQATPVAQVPDMEENNGDEAVNCGSCAEGQFLIAKCDEVAGKDRECRDCR
jgi:hypothetical protein